MRNHREDIAEYAAKYDDDSDDGDGTSRMVITWPTTGSTIFVECSFIQSV